MFTCPTCGLRLNVQRYPVWCRCGTRTWEDGSHEVREKKRPNTRVRGLGDVIAKFTKWLGFKKRCGGCERRRKLLNRLFPHRGQRQ